MARGDRSGYHALASVRNGSKADIATGLGGDVRNAWKADIGVDLSYMTTLRSRSVGMLRRTFSGTTFLLGCVACAEAVEPERKLSPEEMAQVFAQQERQELEDRVRYSVYFSCGGDGELRCQQFAPESHRSIPPAIPLRSLTCDETGDYPRRVRKCSFEVGPENASGITCRVTLSERPGYHSLYWSDALPPQPRPPSEEKSSAPKLPNIQHEPSTLTCSGPLLPLTEPPESVDPAPAQPPHPMRSLTTLITKNDYPIPRIANGMEGVTTVSLRIGSHGRVDGCTVTNTSGSEALDRVTCRVLRTRARFRPARDGVGKAVAAEVSHSHHWVAPR